MVEVVNWPVKSMNDLADLDDWLVANTKSRVQAFHGVFAKAQLAGSYNEPGHPTIMTNAVPQPIAIGTPMRFHFDDPNEAMMFKLTWV